MDRSLSRVHDHPARDVSPKLERTRQKRIDAYLAEVLPVADLKPRREGFAWRRVVPTPFHPSVALLTSVEHMPSRSQTVVDDTLAWFMSQRVWRAGSPESFSFLPGPRRLAR